MSVVMTTSSTGSSSMGSTAGPGAPRGGAAATTSVSTRLSSHMPSSVGFYRLGGEGSHPQYVRTYVPSVHITGDMIPLRLIGDRIVLTVETASPRRRYAPISQLRRGTRRDQKEPAMTSPSRPSAGQSS